MVASGRKPKNFLFYWPAAVTSAHLTRLWWEGNWLCLALFYRLTEAWFIFTIPYHKESCINFNLVEIGFVLNNLVLIFPSNLPHFVVLASQFGGFLLILLIGEKFVILRPSIISP